MENIQRENHEDMILDVVFRYLTNKCQCTGHQCLKMSSNWMNAFKGALQNIILK